MEESHESYEDHIFLEACQGLIEDPRGKYLCLLEIAIEINVPFLRNVRNVTIDDENSRQFTPLSEDQRPYKAKRFLIHHLSSLSHL